MPYRAGRGAPVLAARRAAVDPVRLLAGLGAVASAAWLLWLVGLAQAGCLGAPPHGACPRVDFAAFWGAGRLVDAGRGLQAYRWSALAAELQQALGPRRGAPLPFLYPPPMLLLTAPLGRAPYAVAFAVWSVAGVGAYAAAAWAILRRPAALLAAFAPAGAFFCVFAGQNGFLTAAALALGLLCLERRPLLAGACLALVACKPQLALLAPVALAADRRWRALAAMLGATILLWAASAAVLGADAPGAFLRGATTGGGMFAAAGWLPWWKVQSLYGALRGQGLGAAPALAGQAAATLAAAALVWRVWRGDASASLRGAALAAGALLATPYAFVYDGPLLGVAALFLLRDAQAAPLSPAQTALVAVGLLAQAAFVVAPASLATPAAAAALLGAAVLRGAPFRATASERATRRSGVVSASAGGRAGSTTG